MYTITNDARNFITLENKDDAKKVADLIKGGVYVFINPHESPLLIYYHTDKCA